MTSRTHEPILPASLEYFVKIAEAGSFTAAARALRVSQPTLSVAMRKLEEELGTTLLQRSAKGVTLTATGEVLMRHARHTLQTLELAREEIHALESEPRGRFTLGVHESLAAYLLPGFMARFLEKYPGIALSMWNGPSRDVMRAIVAREVDLGLVVNPESHPDCVVQPLFDDRVELVVSSALRRRFARPIPELFESRPLIYVPVIRQAQYLLGALGKLGIEPRHLACSSMELVKSLVLDGVGVGILPMRVATYGVASGRLVPVAPELPFFDDRIALVRRFDLHRTTAAKILLEALHEHGRAMPELPGRDGAVRTSAKKRPAS